jgi:hypothetical protein
MATSANGSYEAQRRHHTIARGTVDVFDQMARFRGPRHLSEARKTTSYIVGMRAELHSIPDDKLLHRLKDLVADSRRVEADLVAHIGEVDARRLYATQASPSMFSYCTQVLHLSEAEAFLRINAARAARRHPMLLDMLKDGRLHLTVTEKLERLEARRFAAVKAPRRQVSDSDTSAGSRHIPAAVKRTVTSRDGRQCRYEDAQGRRCPEKVRLEFHHRHPTGSEATGVPTTSPCSAGPTIACSRSMTMASRHDRGAAANVAGPTSAQPRFANSQPRNRAEARRRTGTPR